MIKPHKQRIKGIIEDMKRCAEEKDFETLDILRKQVLDESGKCSGVVNKWARTVNELAGWAADREEALLWLVMISPM